jgi:urease accessory protein UreF
MAGKERLSRAAALRRSLTSAETLSHEALYRLMIWLSPAYPVGAFSYSSGIEWAVEAGDITNAVTLREWLEATLSVGAGMSDGIFFAQTHRAVTRDDDAALIEIAAPIASSAWRPVVARIPRSVRMPR